MAQSILAQLFSPSSDIYLSATSLTACGVFTRRACPMRYDRHEFSEATWEISNFQPRLGLRHTSGDTIFPSGVLASGYKFTSHSAYRPTLVGEDTLSL